VNGSGLKMGCGEAGLMVKDTVMRLREIDVELVSAKKPDWIRDVVESD
jgi:hypothetical protein